MLFHWKSTFGILHASYAFIIVVEVYENTIMLPYKGDLLQYWHDSSSLAGQTPARLPFQYAEALCLFWIVTAASMAIYRNQWNQYALQFIMTGT